MADLTLDKLNQIYSKAETADQETFATYRSNILLVAGDHFQKQKKAFEHNLRGVKNVTEQAKIRITKNHMHRIHREYLAMVLSESPDVTITPQNETELQDQKDAELNLAVYEDAKYRYDLTEKYRDYASDFITIGEVAVKLYFDPTKGDLIGHEQAVDEEGNPQFEQIVDPATGMMVQGPAVPDETKPVHSGEFVFERVYGFNLLRSPEAETLDESPVLIVRKMVPVEDLKRRYKDDPEVAGRLTESKDDTYVVFDAAKAGYERVKGQCMVREYYFRPCMEYPKGYFVISTETAKLEEGELPFGVFPVITAQFDKFQTCPRGHSIFKQLRPYQSELNRLASQRATASITTGDDKIIYPSGSKLSQGALLPGVRGVSYQGGQPPTILPGRTGEQYVESILGTIQEMYEVAMLREIGVEKDSGVLDPYALLFRSASRKRKFSMYTAKFEAFQRKLVQTFLELARKYYPDEMVIPAIGKREQVNIAEFRKTTKLAYQIKVTSRSDDLETQFGKQLTMQQVMQYVGGNLDSKTLGKILKNMPFANSKDTFDDLTMDEDCTRNQMLALERGEMPEVNPYIDADYVLRSLTARMGKPDFQFLPPPVQQGYAMLREQYNQVIAEREQKAIALKNEYIPIDGALVTVDVYVQDPNNPENQAKRAKLPQRAIEWLMSRLEEQGANQEKLAQHQAQTLSELAGMLAGPQEPPAPAYQM